MVKRCAIYVYWDAEGVLKSFARHFLLELSKVCQDIMVVINGNLDDESVEFLVGIGCRFIKRANIGYDFGAYRAGLLHIGWEKLQYYDEVVLCNSSFYGPFYPLNSIFEAIDGSIDFWGITAWIGEPWATHIQSYFYVFRRQIINSDEFRRYWNGMLLPKDRAEAIEKCETRLTEHFAMHGFTWTTLLPNNTGGDVSILCARDLLDQKLPFLKRKYFEETSISKAEKIDVLNLLSSCYDLNRIYEDGFYKCCLNNRGNNKFSLKHRIKKFLPTWVIRYYRMLKHIV